MMTKKILVGLGLCSLLAFPAVNAQAEVGFCSNAQVVSAGAFTSGTAVQILNTRTDCGDTAIWPAGTQRTFGLDDSEGQANGMLAAALAAQATGSPILIKSQNANFANGSIITLLYAQSQVSP